MPILLILAGLGLVGLGVKDLTKKKVIVPAKDAEETPPAPAVVVDPTKPVNQ